MPDNPLAERMPAAAHVWTDAGSTRSLVQEQCAVCTSLRWRGPASGHWYHGGPGSTRSGAWSPVSPTCRPVTTGKGGRNL